MAILNDCQEVSFSRDNDVIFLVTIAKTSCQRFNRHLCLQLAVAMLEIMAERKS